MKTLLFKFCLLFSLASFSQTTKITFDLTNFEIGDNPKQSITFCSGGFFHYMNDENTISFEVANLPTLVELSFLNKHKLEPQRIIWIEDTLTKLIGTIESPEFIEISPNYEQQKFTDKVAEYIKKNKELKSELAVTKPYLIHLANRAYFQDITYLDQIMKDIPSDLENFWAATFLKQYLDDYEKIGFNPDKNQLTHLTAINDENKREKIEFRGDKYTLLDFSTSGCGPCLKSIDKLVEIYEHNNEKIEIVMIWNDRNYNAWMNMAKKQKAKITWKSYLDENGAIFKSMNIKIFPTYMLIDKNGIIVKKWKGTPNDLEKYLVNL